MLISALLACSGDPTPKDPTDGTPSDTGTPAEPPPTDSPTTPTTPVPTADTGAPTPSLPRWTSPTERCGDGGDDDGDGLVDEGCEPAGWAGLFPGDPAWLAAIEADTGPIPVIQTYRSTSAAGAANLAADLDRIFGDGRVAHVNLEPSGYDPAQYAAAATDAAIGGDLAQAADTLVDGLDRWPGSRVFLTFGAEMNGSWTDWGCLPPATFVAFHRRFHGLVDDALAARGLDSRRVRWVFGPDSRGSGGCPDPAEYWPDADFAGMSAYRSGTDSLGTTVLGPARALLDDLGWPAEWREGRFLVLQTGSRDADRSAFAAELYATTVSDAELAGAIWFDAADWAVHDGAPLVDYADWAAAVAGMPAVDPGLDGAFDPWFWDVGRAHPRYAEVQALRSAGFTSGCGAAPARFCPEDPLGRDDAAVLLARVFGLADAPAAFDDVAAGAPAAGAIGAVTAAGALPGCGATTFCPDDAVARADLARAVARLAAAPRAEAAFDDLVDPELGLLVDAGWVDGCAPDRFCPDDPATRADGAAWMVHAAVPPAPGPAALRLLRGPTRPFAGVGFGFPTRSRIRRGGGEGFRGGPQAVQKGP